MRTAGELRHGRNILATSTGPVPFMHDVPEYWPFSRYGWKELTGPVLPGCEIRVDEELRRDESDGMDPRYPVVATVFCRKGPWR